MINYNPISVIYKIPPFLLLFFPAALVSGPFLSELIMNIVSVFFLFKLFNKKNLQFLKNKFFIFLSLFFFYIVINSYYSFYAEFIFEKNIFYFRYIIFIFATSYFILVNKNLLKLFFIFLLITIFIVVIDGYIQHFFNFNTLGFPKYREDRLSGFFNDELILGSYLSRLLPLMSALFFLNVKSLNRVEKFLSIALFFITVILIILTGERTATIISVIFVFSLIIFLNYTKVKKLIVFSILSLLIALTFLLSPSVMDRQYKQLVDQADFNFSGETFFSNFQYYELIYQTSFNGFLQKKFFGQGAGSYRYFCSKDDIEVKHQHEVTYLITDILESSDGKKSIYLRPGVKDLNKTKVFLLENNITKINSEFKKGSRIFVYRYFDHDIEYIAPYNLVISKTHITDSAKKGDELKDYYAVSTKWGENGCTTHPHNFYLQILGETGLVGLTFIVILSLYLFFNLISKEKKHNFEICMIIGFLLTLIPILPSGNFFNNWLNMIMFLPAGFYIAFLEIKKNDKQNKY